MTGELRLIAHDAVDFTTREIVGYLLTAFEREHNIRLHGNCSALWRLMQEADEVREKLSSGNDRQVHMPHMHGQKHLNAYVSLKNLLRWRNTRG